MAKEANWDKTIISKKRLNLEGKLGADDTFKGRHIIHRDSPIDCGVYLGQGKREAIVVDSEKQPEIKELYQKAKEKNYANGTPEIKVLRAVFETVKYAMRYDNEAVEKLVSERGVGNDKKISLSSFINKRIGVCRQHALACAVLLELYQKDSILDSKSKISVDRNSTHLGGHAWCRYTNPADEVFILDVAQDYVGFLNDASVKDKWAYERPEDF